MKTIFLGIAICILQTGFAQAQEQRETPQGTLHAEPMGPHELGTNITLTERPSGSITGVTPGSGLNRDKASSSQTAPTPEEAIIKFPKDLITAKAPGGTDASGNPQELKILFPKDLNTPKTGTVSNISKEEKEKQIELAKEKDQMARYEAAQKAHMEYAEAYNTWRENPTKANREESKAAMKRYLDLDALSKKP